MSFFTAENMAMTLGVLFGVSEALAGIPSLKSNSVFQLCFNILKSLSGHVDQPK